LKLNKNS